MSSHADFVNLPDIIPSRSDFDSDAVSSAPAAKNMLKKCTPATKNYEFKNFLIFFLLLISSSVVHNLRDRLSATRCFLSGTCRTSKSNNLIYISQRLSSALNTSAALLFN